MATKRNKLSTKTPLWQRSAIWVILLLTIVSTAALYLSSILKQKSTSSAQKAYTEYTQKYQEYQNKLSDQAKKLSSKYYETFKQYEKQPAAFNAVGVKELAKNDLKVGDGEEINAATIKYSAYYIGWKPDGTVFDSSFDSNSLKSPLTPTKEGDEWGLIKGWSEGVEGMKVGGVREITVPADKAYGESGSVNQTDTSKSIPVNTPLKFIIMIIPTVEEIQAPAIPEELRQ